MGSNPRPKKTRWKAIKYWDSALLSKTAPMISAVMPTLLLLVCTESHKLLGLCYPNVWGPHLFRWRHNNLYEILNNTVFPLQSRCSIHAWKPPVVSSEIPYTQCGVRQGLQNWATKLNFVSSIKWCPPRNASLTHRRSQKTQQRLAAKHEASISHF